VVSAAVLIICHKSIPVEAELKSLIQCVKILNNYPVYLIVPKGMDVGRYTEISSSIKVLFIDQAWQATYQSFNRLKTSSFLYQSLREFEYLLFYELDSWVFRDELSYWCGLDYDYIGAPWISVDVARWLNYLGKYPYEVRKFHQWTGGSLLRKVGNGGFSLRKTKSMLCNTKLFSYRGRYWNANEDSFFAHYVAAFNPFFKLPTVEVALRFSFDVNPSICFQMNDSQLPFGCHGYSRNDLPLYQENKEFWNQFINGSCTISSHT
jgi:hypothetical protein